MITIKNQKFLTLISLLMLINLLAITECFPQNLLDSAPFKITQKSLVKISASEIYRLSSRGRFVIKDNHWRTDDFYLADIRNPSEKKFLFSRSKSNRAKSVRFDRTNDRYLILNKSQGGKSFLEIFDTITKEFRDIKNEYGDIVFASVSDLQNILYQIRPKDARPQIYLVNNSSEILLGDGMGEQWAPNGKWFTFKSPVNPELTLSEKIEYGKRRSEEASAAIRSGQYSREKILWVYGVYSSGGEKFFDITGFRIVDWLRWAPDSKKMVLKDRYNNGFYIIYFKETKGMLEHKNAFHLENFHVNENVFSDFSIPTWSPDGSKIAFKRSLCNSDQMLGDNIWILEENSYNYYQITNFNKAEIKNIKWTNNKEILFTKKIYYSSRDEEVFKITLE